MPSGDGLIVRVRPRSARLAAHRLRALAGLAREAGNGVIELTRRANLQIRGVSRGSLAALQDGLVSLELAEATPERARRPALLVCPLSGLDPRCAPLEPLAGALEQLLSVTPAARRLSDKFGLVLSGGSHLCAEVSADIRIQLDAAQPGLADLRLAGTAASACSLGTCPIGDVPSAVARLLSALGSADSGWERMRDALEGGGLARLHAAVQHLLGPARRMPSWSSSCLGFQSGKQSYFGLSVPFGSAGAEAWAGIADLADDLGSGELRLTPARQVLVTGVREADLARLVERAKSLGFGVEPTDRSLELVACSGAPACQSSHGETRRLALELGELVRHASLARGTLHVSGCDKGCARSGAAEVTLVWGADGPRLGFGTDVAQTSSGPRLSLATVRERVSAQFACASVAEARAARPAKLNGALTADGTRS